MSFDGLLVETRPLAPSAEKTVRADGRKVAFAGSLNDGQPFQSREAGLHHFLTPHLLTADHQRLGQRCIGVSKRVLKPLPVVGGVFAVQLHQPFGQRIADVLHGPVSRKPQTILMNAEQRERPGTRTGEVLNCGQRQFKEPAGHSAKAVVL